MKLTVPHTQGPWSLEKDGCLVMQGQVVSFPIGTDDTTREEHLANNSLIAAAPDLLAAAKMALNAMGAETALAAAVAKAQGEEQ